MPKLTKVKVEKLLDRFDHEIEFPEDDSFVIVYGPNGVGKTKLLELIYAVSNGRLGRAATFPFFRATFEYSSRHVLTLSRVEAVGYPPESGELGAIALHATLVRPSLGNEASDAEVESDAVKVFAGPVSADAIFHPEHTTLTPGILRRIERELPVNQIDADSWEDYEAGDVLSTAEVLDRYEDILGLRSPGDEVKPGDGRNEILAFLSDAPAHMVETQRLLVGRAVINRRRRVERPAPSAVEQYARDLARRIQAALAENSTVSQRLDRSFPKRLLTEPRDPQSLTDDAIRKRYAEQTELRDQLTRFSVSDAAEAIQLPDRPLQDWERSMLDKYMDDADEKLRTFESLLRKLNLFTEIVNSRFLFKNLSVDREQGLAFETSEGVSITPRDLSSGEQHEIVLNYDLLFNVKPGSIVLIDEPEISLHVVWQQAFLEDLNAISELVDARFIVATHSPQIIHNWMSRAHSLFELEDV